MKDAQKRSRGRPRSENRRELVSKCRRPDCFKSPAANQVYCSRDHAPFGYYGLEDAEDQDQNLSFCFDLERSDDDS